MKDSTYGSTAPYISAVEAGKQFGYTNDYVTRLAREKKIRASRSGRQWFVDVDSLRSFIAESEQFKKQNSERVREERRKERFIAESLERKRRHDEKVRKELRKQRVGLTKVPSLFVLPPTYSRSHALAKAGIVFCVVAMLMGVFFMAEGDVRVVGAWSKRALISVYKGGQEAYVLGVRVFRGDAFSKLSTNAERGDINGAAAYLGVPEADQAVVIVPPGENKTNAEIAKSFSDEVLITQDNN